MPRRKLTEEEKKARKEKLEKEHIARNLESSKERLVESYLPEPTVMYEIGQRVQCGAHEEAYIKEIVDSGRVYKLFLKGLHNNYGKKVPYEKEMYVPWVSIEPYPYTNYHMPLFKHDDKLQIQYSQRDLSGLLHCHYHFGIDMDVDYQRGNVWSLEDKQNLIDSIFKNVDIGKFVLIHRPFKENTESYEILDGKQRLTALLEFYELRFKYNGYTLHELNQFDKTHFKHYMINWGEIRQLKGKPIPKKYLYEYFIKLNTHGHVVDSKHIDYVRSLYEKEK